MDCVGFVFSQKECVYIRQGLEVDLEFLNTINLSGDNTGTKSLKEDSEDGKYLQR